MALMNNDVGLNNVQPKLTLGLNKHKTIAQDIVFASCLL